MAKYRECVNADISEMMVEFIDMHDPYINAMGVEGIGKSSTWLGDHLLFFVPTHQVAGSCFKKRKFNEVSIAP